MKVPTAPGVAGAAYGSASVPNGAVNTAAATRGPRGRTGISVADAMTEVPGPNGQTGPSLPAQAPLAGRNGHDSAPMQLGVSQPNRFQAGWHNSSAGPINQPMASGGPSQIAHGNLTHPAQVRRPGIGQTHPMQQALNGLPPAQVGRGRDIGNVRGPHMGVMNGMMPANGSQLYL